MWQPASKLPAGINSRDDDYEPRVSADGLTLYFVRGKAGNNADIHFFLDNGRTKLPKAAAIVHEPKSGRVMEVFTTEPGVQFYAGLFLSVDAPEIGKGKVTYPAKGGFCLETQDYADSVNCPEMGGAILTPDESYSSTTLYRFSAK